MNTKKLVAAVILLVASCASYAENTSSSVQAGQKTRADVIAELKQAYADGSMPTNDADFSLGRPSDPVIKRGTTRTQ
jgi:hypothetical protein